MEGHLLDTVIASWICSKRSLNHTMARERLGQLSDDPVYVCSISIGEVDYGFQLRPDIDALYGDEVRQAMRGFKTLDVDHHTSRWYGQIKARLFQSHAPRDKKNQVKQVPVERLRYLVSGNQLGIQENDLWIVSVAIQHNLVFVTNDRAEGMRRVLDAAGYFDRTQFWTPDSTA